MNDKKRAAKRGYVSVKDQTYVKLKAYAKQRGKKISTIIEEWVKNALDKAGAP